MGHHIVACEEFYVHNNILIYLERMKTIPEELLHPAYMYPSCNQISYRTDLCYITLGQKKKISLTSLLRIYHLSHVLADFGLCYITLHLKYIYSFEKFEPYWIHTVLPLLLDSVVVLF